MKKISREQYLAAKKIIKQYNSQNMDKQKIIHKGDLVRCVLVNKGSAKQLTANKLYEAIEIVGDVLSGDRYFFYIRDDNGLKRRYSSNNKQFVHANFWVRHGVE